MSALSGLTTATCNSSSSGNKWSTSEVLLQQLSQSEVRRKCDRVCTLSHSPRGRKYSLAQVPTHGGGSVSRVHFVLLSFLPLSTRHVSNDSSSPLSFFLSQFSFTRPRSLLTLFGVCISHSTCESSNLNFKRTLHR